MSAAPRPSRKTLAAAWLALMALTIGTMAAGRVTTTSSLGPLSMTALAAITWLKATWILRYYLDLKSAGRGWNTAFTLFLFLLLAIVVAIYVIPGQF